MIIVPRERAGEKILRTHRNSHKHFPLLRSTLAAMLTLFPALPSRSDDSRLRQRVLALQEPPRIVGAALGDKAAGLSELAFVVLWLVGVGYSLIPKWSDDPIFSLIFLGFAAFFYSWLRGWLQEFLNRRLVQSGECTVGWVDSQMIVRQRRTQTSEITYVFTDAQGQIWRGKGTDRTKRYVPQMPLVVFYDANRPPCNVAACATIWRVRGVPRELLELV